MRTQVRMHILMHATPRTRTYERASVEKLASQKARRKLSRASRVIFGVQKER